MWSPPTWWVAAFIFLANWGSLCFGGKCGASATLGRCARVPPWCVCVLVCSCGVCVSFCGVLCQAVLWCWEGPHGVRRNLRTSRAAESSHRGRPVLCPGGGFPRAAVGEAWECSWSSWRAQEHACGASSFVVTRGKQMNSHSTQQPPSSRIGGKPRDPSQAQRDEPTDRGFSPAVAICIRNRRKRRTKEAGDATVTLLAGKGASQPL